MPNCCSLEEIFTVQCLRIHLSGYIYVVVQIFFQLRNFSLLPESVFVCWIYRAYDKNSSDKVFVCITKNKYEFVVAKWKRRHYFWSFHGHLVNVDPSVGARVNHPRNTFFHQIDEELCRQVHIRSFLHRITPIKTFDSKSVAINHTILKTASSWKQKFQFLFNIGLGPTKTLLMGNLVHAMTVPTE